MVEVLLLKEGANPYQRSSYELVHRRSNDELGTPRARLETALRELVRGATPNERARGYVSIFSEETANIVRSVRVEDGHANVDLIDFRDTIPQAATSEGGFIFMMSVLGTVFSVADVDSVQFTMAGDCDLFGRFVEQGTCRTVSREEFERPDPEPPGPVFTSPSE